LHSGECSRVVAKLWHNPGRFFLGGTESDSLALLSLYPAFPRPAFRSLVACWLCRVLHAETCGPVSRPHSFFRGYPTKPCIWPMDDGRAGSRGDQVHRYLLVWYLWGSIVQGDRYPGLLAHPWPSLADMADMGKRHTWKHSFVPPPLFLLPRTSWHPELELAPSTKHQTRCTLRGAHKPHTQRCSVETWCTGSVCCLPHRTQGVDSHTYPSTIHHACLLVCFPLSPYLGTYYIG
jgi:hypothetical protein